MSETQKTRTLHYPDTTFSVAPLQWDISDISLPNTEDT
jgi:hypothetical protein